MAGAKKYKIFKICKELNLGHETIIAFLEQKGIKVSGLNSSIAEEVYFEILENFASDKIKAEALKKRKSRADTAEEEAVEAQPVEESGYLKAIKQSIEEGVEAIERSKDEPVPEKPKKKTRPRKVVRQEPAELPGTFKPTEEQAQQETPEEKKPKAKPAKEEKSRVTAKKEAPPAVKKVIKEKSEEEKKSEEQEKSAKKKKKAKERRKQQKQGDRELTEKEKKHRKAIEMIRKDKSGRGGIPMEDIFHGDRPLTEGKKRRTKKHKRKQQVDIKDVQDTVKKTLASMEGKGKKPKKQRKIKNEQGEEIIEKIIQVTEFISVSDLSNLMDVSAPELITKCLELGLVVSINQRLDIDTITLLAEEYGYKVEEQFAAEFIDEEIDEEDNPEDLVPRAAIVTIMGHVDHGKTSLLDYLRKSKITEGEAGGITQHIGAYEVGSGSKRVTFLDTPGHEAFTAMRARGAQVTDIVVLIIAADDAVMPQTDEALDHAKAAGVKIVIAINKIDKPGADPERIKKQLADRDILVEDWGGSYQCVEISAKTGKGIPEFLEKLQLEAEMLDLKANPKRSAQGVVIESRLDKGKGPIATVLVQKGTLHVGDSFIAGHQYGKVRAILNEKNERLKEVYPSQPALIVGFMGVPQAGDRFVVMKDERTVRELSNKRQQLKREQDGKQVKMLTLAQISEQIKRGEVNDLPILVKADVDGSAEALADSLINLNTDEVAVNIVRKAVGPISESDVLLASASGAVIIGFHVRANSKARELAEHENIDIRYYKVIYDAINDIKMAMEGMLAPSLEEKIVGVAEIRETFKISRLGVIAGCYVTSGKIFRNNKIRLMRNDVEIYNGSLSSLKRFKDDVKEVSTGFECGIQIENFNDLKVGDIIESYEVSEVKRVLA